MGMKTLPNVKIDWGRSDGIFFCQVIVGLFTRKQFMAILKCLHITNPLAYAMDRESPQYGKMHQTKKVAFK